MDLYIANDVMKNRRFNIPDRSVALVTSQMRTDKPDGVVSSS